MTGGGKDLTLTGTGTQTVASGTGLDVVTATNLTTGGALSATSVAVSGAASLGGGVTTTGNQSYGSTTLTADVTLATGTGTLSTGAVTGGGKDLTLTGTGTQSSGAISGVDVLTVTNNLTSSGAVSAASLTTTGALSATSVTTTGDATLGASVTTTGAQTYGGNTSLNGTYTTSNSTFSVGGATTLAGNTTVTTGSGAGDIQFAGTVNGTAAGAQSLTLTAGTGNVVLTGAVGGTKSLGAVSINSAKDVTTAAINSTSLSQLAGTGATTLGGAVNTSGALSITTTGNITGTGALTVGGNSTFTANGTNASINVGNAANAFTGTVKFVGASLQNVTVADSTALALDMSTLSGNLVVSSGGAVTQAAALTVGGTTSVTATGQDVTLGNAANNFTGAVSVAGRNVTMVDANALNLGAGTVTGNLAVTAGGAVTNTGALAVTGTTTVSAAGQDVTLGNAANNFTGAVSVTGKNVTLVDASALNLGASTATGNLAVTAGGAVSQSAALTVTGTTTFSAAGQSVTLDNTGNDFTGAVSLTGGATKITDKNALTLGTLATGALTVNSTGALNLGQGTVSGAFSATSGNADITQSGALTVTGFSTVNAGTANVTLNQAANNFASSTASEAEFKADAADKQALFGNVFTGTTVNLRDTNGITGTVRSVDFDLKSLGNTYLYLRNLAGEGKAGVGNATIDTGTGNLYLSGSGSGFKGRSLVLDNVGAVLTDGPGQTFALHPDTVSVKFLVGGQNVSAVSSSTNVVGGDSARDFISKIYTPTASTSLNGLLYQSFTNLSNAFAPTLILPAVNDAERRSQERAAGIGALKERVQRGSVSYEELVAPVPYDSFKARQAPCSAEQSAGSVGGTCAP